MSADFMVALHPLNMHTRKGSFVTGLMYQPWCIPMNFRNTESCKRQKNHYCAVLINYVLHYIIVACHCTVCVLLHLCFI